jgi:EmrB/QacA subfamily drug resistance transporter
MIILDGTIVVVALPSIRADVGLSATLIPWLMNAYLIAFGGFLLLGGRLGDLFGHRRLFVCGTVLFSISSLACGLTHSGTVLIGARAIQGLGGAVVSSVALSLIMKLFREPSERAKAMGAFGIVSAGGGSAGLLLGGALTSTLDWHWIFIVNVPVGFVVCVFSFFLLPKEPMRSAVGRLDVAGALAVTASLTLFNYAIVNAGEAGWYSRQILIELAGAAGMLLVFVFIESRASSPLVPLNLFRRRGIAVANTVGALWAFALYAWALISALYLQQVLERTPLEVALALLPSNILMAVFALWISAKLVMHHGIKRPLVIGLLFTAGGLALFAIAPMGGSAAVEVLPATLLVAAGIGSASNPLLLTALCGAATDESGLASGLVTTAFSLGGALGIAILLSFASAHTSDLLATGASPRVALHGGYHIAALGGAAFATAAAIVGTIFLRKDT